MRAYPGVTYKRGPMDLTVHIPDEAVPALKAKASGLPLETFAEQVLLDRIRGEDPQAPDSSVAEAARRLGTFGKRHVCRWAS